MSHNTAEASRCEAKATAGLGTRAAQLSIQNTQKLYSRSSPSIIFEYSMCRINTRATSASIIFEYFEYSIAQGGGPAQGVLQPHWHHYGAPRGRAWSSAGPKRNQAEPKRDRSGSESDQYQAEATLQPGWSDAYPKRSGGNLCQIDSREHRDESKANLDRKHTNPN